jgi:uncharacterized protein YqcC (DUF446 family)
MQQFEIYRQQRLITLLIELEIELKASDLWKENTPSDECLASTEPFAIDTLTFPEWLQFLFIEKMMQLIKADLPLPNAMAIAPMATEYFNMIEIKNQELIAVITRIDLVINEKIKC